MEKESLEIENLKKLARERLLTGQYGKYDYVEDLLDSEYIIKTKPRNIRQYISKMLEIPEEQINQQTFFSWLRNYKKREQKKAKTKKDSSSFDNQKSSEKNINDPSSPNNQNLAENNINDPFNFIPTDPLTLIKKNSDISSLIKIANRP